MEELLKRHIDETDRRFDELLSEISALSSKLESINDFKTQTIVSTRWISGLISAASGLFTLIASSAVTYFLSKR